MKADPHADTPSAELYLQPGGRARFRDEQLYLEDGRSLGDALEPWQREHILTPLDARDSDGHPTYRVLVLEAPRGHAKTTLLAAECLLELIVGGRDRRIFAFAADADQAALLHEAAAGFIRRNTILGRLLSVERWLIRCRATRSVMRVMSADAASAHGLTPDLIVVDELAQWQGRELWDACYSSVAKKSDARLVVITTPGWRRDSIAWEVREAARKIPGYYFWSAGERRATWLDAAEYERQRAMLPPHVFRRLHDGLWSDGAGAFITSEDLAGCIRSDRRPRTECPERWHVLALDLGLTNDRTAAAIAHRTEHGIALDLLRTWQGSRAAPISITREVEPFIADAFTHYRNLHLVLDPWQARSTFERFNSQHPTRVESFIFTTGRIDEMTRNLYALAHSGALELYPDPDIERELLDVQLVERAQGLRIDSRRRGHDDRAIALGMAGHAAMEQPYRTPHPGTPPNRTMGPRPLTYGLWTRPF